MRIWNIGNTTVRNPSRLRKALELFVATMSGRPFRIAEQLEFQQAMIEAGLVESERTEGDDGGRKFASAFKQLGFITDWSRGKSWNVTEVGRLLIDHPNMEETIFLRQLLKYQIPSPLESGSRVEGFNLRPFRLFLSFLRRVYTENLVGLTKHEIGIYVINVLDENDNTAFENAIEGIKLFRSEYNALVGRVAKDKFAKEKLADAARKAEVRYETLNDYADSNSRYAFMSGLLELRGNKLAISESRLPLVDTILLDTSPLTFSFEYLDNFYDPEFPPLPIDDIVFIRSEILRLEEKISEIGNLIGESIILPPPAKVATLPELQAYATRLRDTLRRVREIQFYLTQRQPSALDEIEELLESISAGSFLLYAPAYLEWAIWRLFLALNEFTVPVSDTRGFKINEDMNPIHHAKGGDADLIFTYNNFKLVCEMTLTNGSRQFAAEGEPVTRHVFKAIEKSYNQVVYGLFVAKNLDPNTIHMFHKAQYWGNWTTSTPIPIVALEIKHIITLIQFMKIHSLTITDVRELFDHILNLQSDHPDGPSWYKAYIKVLEEWISQKSHPALDKNHLN